MNIKVLLLLFVTGYLSAQPEAEPIVHYSFEGGSVEDVGIAGRDGIVSGSPEVRCGIIGDALALDGEDDFIRFPDNFSTIFAQNFTFSFYFKPEGGSGEQQLFSYTDACNDALQFEITYSPGTNNLRVEYGENNSDRIVLEAELDPNRCWYHIVLIRDGRRQSLRVDNKIIDEAANLIRIDFNNPGTFSIADGPCVGSLFNRFRGVIDEVQIFNEVLGTLDLDALYLAPESILTPDTLLYLGGDVNLRVASGCSDSFEWFPTEGLSNPDIAEPVARPDTTTTYTLRFTDAGCSTTDQVQVLVVDPDDVGCEKLAMANGFTPNNDGINDEFGLANPFVIDELISLRIFDQSGGLMFETSEAQGTWDGSYKGQPVNSGTYLFQITYLCSGEEKVQQGTVVVLR